MPLELDVDAVLQPFEGESRAGVDQRESDDPTNSYRKVRDSRSRAFDAEKKADNEAPSAEPSQAIKSIWMEVWEQGTKYLSSVAKDLEIVAYMLEASIRIDGFGGFAQSLQLTRELIDGFWGEILPTPDETGFEPTLLPLARLNGSVITYALHRVALTDSRSVGRLVYWQFADAKWLESQSQEDQASAISRGRVSLQTLRAAIADTSDEFLRKVYAEIKAASEQLSSLSSTLIAKVGESEAPGFSKFREALKNSSDALEELAGERLKPPAADVAESPATSGVQTPHAGESNTQGGINSRSSALDTLERVARWFESHEPQSILPLEIRKAIRRAKMSPQELYAELISNEDVRRELYKDVGIVIPDQQSY